MSEPEQVKQELVENKLTDSEPAKKKKFFTRRKFLYTSVAAAFTNAFFIEPNISSISYRNVRLPYLPPALNGLKVVHLTDFHYKPDKNESLMDSIIEKVNRVGPDLILLTGDYVDGDYPDVAPLIEKLSRLKSKHGIYASMGNHDGWLATGEHYREKFAEIGIPLLINENIKLTINNEHLYIAATDYIWDGNPDPVKTLKGIPNNAPLITLVHEPDYFDTMLEHHDHHLQLSGHTHGGQCRIPFLNYAPRKVKYGRNYIHGIYKKKDSSVWVSKGIGTTGIKVRFSCLPEIAVLTLVG